MRGEDAARAVELWSISVLARTYGTGVGPQLWVAAENARATTFYAEHGFVEDGVTAVDESWDLPEKRMVR